jgi:hypothetical protein
VENRHRLRDDGSDVEIGPLLKESPMSTTPFLSAEQEAEAQRIFAVLKQTSEQDLLAMARLLASKSDGQLLGKTEFEVRDRVHEIGAKAIETALAERKKRGTTGRV